MERREAEEREQQQDGADVHEPREQERARHADGGGERAQALLAVELDVLAGVERVEARHPQQHGEPQHDRDEVEAAADREPRRRPGRRRAPARARGARPR
jgi:hypothetical protein